MDICDDDEEEEKEDLRKKITKAKGELENLRYKELASENARGRTTVSCSMSDPWSCSGIISLVTSLDRVQ